MQKEILFAELHYKAVRSSGAGGQHVNKVATKIQLVFDVAGSAAFTDDEKALLMRKLENRLTKEGVLLLGCGESRSQLKNKEIVTTRFLSLIQQALQLEKERKATRIPHAAVKKRIQNKRFQAQKKESRRKPGME